MNYTPCPNCRTPKSPRKYLCPDCWGTLPLAARRALNRRDSWSMMRLQDLYTQISTGVPLHNVRVSP